MIIKSKALHSFIVLTLIGFLILSNLAMTAPANAAINSSTDFAGGDGTASHPYEIATAEQLNNVRHSLSAHYILTDNIDLSSISNWQLIGSWDNQFTGEFDGAGFEISHLNMANDDNLSLFGFTSGATIQNIKIKNPIIAGGAQVAALIAVADSTTVRNVVVEGGEITSTGAFSGGLIAVANDSTIENIYSSATINSTNTNVGGGIGLLERSTLDNAYATGSVKGYSLIGGLVGEARNSTVKYSYAIGKVTGEQGTGGLIGKEDMDGPGMDEYQNTIINSLYNKETTGQSDTGNGEPKTTEEMMLKGTYVDWDFTNTWEIDPQYNNGYPYLQASKTDSNLGTDDGGQQSVPVQEVTVDKSTLTLTEGGASEKLNITIVPANASNQNVTWGSSDEAVASVDQDGTVTPIAEGTATITVTTVDGSFTATTAVTVEASQANGNETNSDVKSPVFAGNYVSFFIDSEGSLWSLGSNGNGILGIGKDSYPFTKTNIPRKVTAISNVVEVNSYQSHVVAIDKGGNLYTWGSNDHKQLGIGEEQGEKTTPQKVSIDIDGHSFGNVVSVATGLWHTLAVKEDGTVWAWGDNANGQLGTSDNASANRPKQIPNLSNIVAVAASGFSSMALDKDGNVWTWGANNNGQLGHGDKINLNLPKQIEGLQHVTDISIGGYHAAVVKSDGTVWSWGGNTYGFLGNGTTISSLVPVQAKNLTNVKTIGVGNTHTIALDNSGNLWSWGSNGFGLLGHPEITGNILEPKKVTDIENVVSVSVGPYHTLINTVDGKYWGVGSNTNGAIGASTDGYQRTPIEISLHLSDEKAVEYAKDNLTIGYALGETRDWATKDVTLSNAGDFEVNIEWSSSLPEIISINGVVNQPSSTTEVTLTATITKNNVTDTKEFKVKVKQPHSWGKTFDQFTHPNDIEFDQAGNIYIIDSGRLYKKSKNSDEWIALSDEERRFIDVAVTNDGDIYVIENQTVNYRPFNKLLTLTEAGWTSVEDEMDNAKGITASGNDLYIYGYSYKQDDTVESAIKKIHSLGLTNLSETTHFNDISSVAVNQSGEIYLYDRASWTGVTPTLYKLNGESWLPNSLENINSKIISYINFDSKGNIYALGYDLSLNKTVMWEGNFKAEEDSIVQIKDSEDSKFFSGPSAMKFSGDSIYVVDRDGIYKKKVVQQDNGNGGTTPPTPTPTPTPSPSPDSSPDPSPTTEEIIVDVDGEDGTNLAKTPITRTTDSDGTMKDKVSMSESIAKDTVVKAKQQGMDTARIVIPDTNDKVSEVTVEIPKSALKQLNDGKLKLEIATDNAIIAIPTASISSFGDDLYFRVVPLKTKEQQKQVEERAKKEEIIQEIAQNKTVQVLGRPMEIETNMQNREVSIVLPLKDSLPADAKEREKILENLAIFIEHSDGTKEVLQGKVISYKNNGELGLEFTVNKFSTFTIVYMDGAQSYFDGQSTCGKDALSAEAIGCVNAKKTVPVYELVNNRLKKVDAMKAGQSAPVYQAISPMLGLGGDIWVERTNAIRYETPSKAMLVDNAVTGSKRVKQIWKGLELRPGQIGKVTVLQDTVIWEKINKTKKLPRVLKKGEQYRVYRYVPGMYDLGNGKYVVQDDNIILNDF